jgi:hypothetical protein
MDKCADAGFINDASTSCNIANQIIEPISGVLDKLPGDNPPTGWGQGAVDVPSTSSAGESISVTATAQANVNSAAPSDTAGTDNSESGWSYLGCYSDNISARALKGVQFANLGVGKVTSTGCMEYCGKAGFSLAGTEYASECFCGDKLEGSIKFGAEKCEMKCSGDESQICGGSAALSVYESSDKTSTRKLRRHLRNHLHGAHA